MNSFNWKNKDSYLEFGIVINKLPSDVIPELDIDTIEIKGRDGDLTINNNNAKKSYTLPMECTLLDFTRIEEIKAWLSGSGDLIFNNEDYKYEARLNNKIDIAQSLETLGEFQLIWKVQPYKKAIYTPVITLTTPDTVYNSSWATSKPIIKVYGTGSIDLIINSNVIHLTNIVDYVIIDSELMDAYHETQLMNNNMVGEFPLFQIQDNFISWTGNVSSIEVTPNWRYL